MLLLSHRCLEFLNRPTHFPPAVTIKNYHCSIQDPSSYLTRENGIARHVWRTVGGFAEIDPTFPYKADNYLR